MADWLDGSVTVTVSLKDIEQWNAPKRDVLGEMGFSEMRKPLEWWNGHDYVAHPVQMPIAGMRDAKPEP